MVSMGTVKTLLTFTEFEKTPDRPGKEELVRGQLIELPPKEIKHHLIGDRVYDFLDAAIDQAHARGEAGTLGEALYEVGYRLPGECWLQPDVSVTHAGQRVKKYLLGAPAIAVEVITPSNAVEHVDAKAELYFEFGAREVWRFFPKTKQATIQTRDGSRAIPADSALTTPLLPGLAVSVKDLFGE